MNVIIVKKNGEQYETPIGNLENVKRLVEYKDIIFPDHEEQSEEGEGVTVTKVKGKNKKGTN